MIIQAAIATFLAWFTTRLIKASMNVVKEKNFSLKTVLYDSGFPSSHTGLVIGLVTSVYLEEGATMLFLAALIFALVVAYDSFKLRHIVGEHSKMLNAMAKKGSTKFTERVGHTILEVVCGAIIGIIVPWLLYTLVW